MIPKRFDSLFLRLLLAQVLLVGSALLVFGALLVIERNQLMAPQYAHTLAPKLAQAARSPADALIPAFGVSEGLRRQPSLPEGLKLNVSHMPAVLDFSRELRLQGVTADEAWISLQGTRPILWLHVKVEGAESVWLSGYAPRLFPHWTPRITLAVLLLGAVLTLVSRSIARRITRPLSQLQERMHAHAHAGSQGPEGPNTMMTSQAPPELIEIDRAYRLLAERLQRNERERALLLAGVSHDLRSPLSRIRLAAEMLPETAENALGVSAITRNVDNADRLTASFIEFIRAGVVELSEEVDLAAAARRAVAAFDRPEAELALRAPPSLCLQNAHGLLVERLIINLVDNALKHGRPPVMVEIRQDAESALLIVSDHGPGLPQDGGKHLLEAFARGDASRNLPGFGLGLAIAQQTVLRLQGELSFERPDGRHQIQVRVPLSR